MTTTIAFMRHGEVLNPQGIVYGRLPGFDLSEEGCRQAAAAGRFVADKLVVDQIFSSPMLRAQHTAVIIAQGKPVQESLLLNETHSYYEGQPATVLAGLKGDFYTGVPAEFEQPAAIVNRLSEFIREIRAAHAGQTIVAVSHGDPIAFLILSLKGEALLPANKFKLDQLGVPDGYPAHASLTLVEFISDDPIEIPAVTYHKPYE